MSNAFQQLKQPVQTPWGASFLLRCVKPPSSICRSGWPINGPELMAKKVEAEFNGTPHDAVVPLVCTRRWPPLEKTQR